MNKKVSAKDLIHISSIHTAFQFRVMGKQEPIAAEFRQKGTLNTPGQFKVANWSYLDVFELKEEITASRENSHRHG